MDLFDRLPERLIEGYRSFRRGRLTAERERHRTLAGTSRQPETMIVGCCASRVSPEVIFDAAPGEPFIARNVANPETPCAPAGRAQGVSAVLEAADEGLRVRHTAAIRPPAGSPRS